MAFIQIHLTSKVLGMDENVWAFIPEIAAFDEPNKKFKVLWFLHGGSGDQTTGAMGMNLSTLATKYNIAVIMPTVHHSCFVDMHMGPKYATYIGQELPLILRAMFPFLSDKREDNIISGFSNGGYGTFHLALKFPEIFGYGGAFAAGDKADADWSGRMELKEVLFGADDISQSEYSIRNQALQLAYSGRVLPKLFHVCGENDPWHAMNKLVRECFEGISGNPYEYAYYEVPERGHDRSCWQIALEKFIDDYLKLKPIAGRIF